MKEKINDTNIIAALIISPTIEDAAQVASVSPRTIYRKLNDPEFKSDFKSAQNKVLLSAINHMTLLFGKAVFKLDKLLDAESEYVQLQAVRTVLQYGTTLRRDLEYDERIQVLEDENLGMKFITEECNEENGQSAI